MIMLLFNRRVYAERRKTKRTPENKKVEACILSTVVIAKTLEVVKRALEKNKEEQIGG